MKKNKIYLIAAALFVAFTMVTTSCEDDPKDTTLPPISGYNTSDDVANANLVARFSFENDIADAQGNVTGGSSTNVSFTTGAKGMAWQGSTDGYTVYDNPGEELSGLQSFTIAFWVNTSVHTDGAEALFMLSNQDSWIGNLFLIQEAGALDNDSIRFKFKFDNWDATEWKEQWIDFTDDQKFGGLVDTWAHLAFSYDGLTSKFNVYVNGEKLELPEDFINRYQSDPAAGGNPLGNASFKGVTKFVFGAYQNMVGVGGAPDAWMKNYDGQLDEFRIYSKALIDTDVTALYELEVAGR